MSENTEVANLRNEIDTVDEQILWSIERRLELAERMAVAKAGVNQHSPLRPDRERFILERLKTRARLASSSLIDIVWREIIGECRQLQGTMRLVLAAAADMALLEECARRQFGSAVPVETVATADEALDAARRSPAIAIVERRTGGTGLVEVDEVTTSAGTVLGYAYARVDHEGAG